MEATEQENRQVEEIMSRVCQARGLDRDAARKLLHRYVCGGKCEWYQTKSKAAGFRKGGLSEEERATMQSAMREVLGEVTEEEVWRVIHGVLCPGATRARSGQQGE